jgi:hypothetical protein
MICEKKSLVSADGAPAGDQCRYLRRQDQYIDVLRLNSLWMNKRHRSLFCALLDLFKKLYARNQLEIMHRLGCEQVARKILTMTHITCEFHFMNPSLDSIYELLYIYMFFTTVNGSVWR